jgi:hypothetical protein
VNSLSLRRYGPSPGSHSHTHYQVLWGWRGSLELDIEGRGSRIDAGRVAVIPPDARHDFQAAATRSDCFVVDSDASVLESQAGRVLQSRRAAIGGRAGGARQLGRQAIRRALCRRDRLERNGLCARTPARSRTDASCARGCDSDHRGALRVSLAFGVDRRAATLDRRCATKRRTGEP